MLDLGYTLFSIKLCAYVFLLCGITSTCRVGLNLRISDIEIIRQDVRQSNLLQITTKIPLNKQTKAKFLKFLVLIVISY